MFNIENILFLAICLFYFWLPEVSEGDDLRSRVCVYANEVFEYFVNIRAGE